MVDLDLERLAAETKRDTDDHVGAAGDMDPDEVPEDLDGPVLSERPSGLPIIKITVDLPRVVDQAAEALAADKSIFQRDGYLVRVVRVAEDEADAKEEVGTPQIRELPHATLRERLCDVSDWARYVAKTDEWVATLPTSPVVQALAERGAWRNIRPLSGIIETPSMRPDGVAIVEPGYDSPTGFLYEPSCEFPAVPDQPTQAQACDSLAQLCEVWCDFPFASEAARYAPVAAVLSLVGRPAILGPLPAIVVDANCPGTGKTLCNQAVVLTSTGRRPPPMTFPPDELELEKVLGSYALRGAAVVPFDNLAGPFCGAPLDKILTAWPTVDLRVLGKSEVPTLRWNALVLATGNGVEIRGDTTRRVLVCRLETNVENPEERTGFAHPDLLTWVEQERPRLVAAALTILRGYVAAGRPDVGIHPWGSFEAWSRLVPFSIIWAGGANVLDARATVAADEPEDKRALRVILQQWPMLAPKGSALRTAMAALYSREQLRGEAPPDGFDALREAIETLVPTRQGVAPSTHKLGNALRKMRRRVIAGKCLETFDDSHSKIQVWRVV